ncbi:ABC transporter permease [Clostridium oceanicum]|uniref:ABC transporter permease n=1 Tax=Clostridium oceanicum TaxID=1543 RepID=A0ABP3V5N5_9CLOT
MTEISRSKFEMVGIDKSLNNEISRPNITYWKDAWRRLKGNKVAIVSLIVLLLIGLMTIIGPHLTSYKYWATDSSIVNMSPNSKHWFGTDTLGRDLFSRVWKGGRVSIIIGILGTFIEMTIGVIYGGISGYFGGKVDEVMMRIVEILLSVPYLIVVIIISLILGKGILSLVIAMTITGWCGMARIIRGQILKIREQEYVLAAKALGASPLRIIKKHLIPNTIGILIVNITLDIPSFIFAEAFLSYIGLGIQSPNTSWGSLASAAQPNLIFYPYQLFFPALFISLTMLAFNLLGDGLRDALDPKLRQ